MIKYYNRQTKEYEVEQVAGEKYLQWTYSSQIGTRLLELLIKKKLFSKLYGAYCDNRRSAKKVRRFVESFGIDMEQSMKSMDDFVSFNDFFTRRLKEEARPVDRREEAMVSPGDGRLLVFEDIDLDRLVQVKGFEYRLEELLGNSGKNLVAKYEGGVCMILRLCPTDYHRFHFVDDGTCGKTVGIEGDYYSVNPVALSKIPELFCRNKREWSVFQSDHFGDILHVEVGATCVGTIVQTYADGQKAVKGQEKGYFKFGGSTTILFLEKDKVHIDREIIEQSKEGYETKVLMGEKIGERA